MFFAFTEICRNFVPEYVINMRKTTLQLLFLLMPLLVFGQAKWNQRYADYIDTYKDLAIEQMVKHKIPASITLAQGLLESGAGYSELARKSNNHFGIKCHDWRGRKTYHDDDAAGECFRAYDNPRQSYEDHSTFLRSKPRYASLFRLQITDYRGWAYGLKAAGYATNPQYAQSLISLIERYDLDQYDRAKSYKRKKGRSGSQILPANYHPIRMCNRNYYLVAREGDTFKSISREVGVSYRKLARYNERDKDDVLQAGDIVYLEKKRTKADKSLRNTFHTVQSGESMYSIAQKYGIRLKSLYEKNLLPPDHDIKVGDKLLVY